MDVSVHEECIPDTVSVFHLGDTFTDLSHVDTYQFEFNLGQPFKPFEQLMGVLPEASSAHIPPAFRVCHILMALCKV